MAGNAFFRLPAASGLSLSIYTRIRLTEAAYLPLRISERTSIRLTSPIQVLNLANTDTFIITVRLKLGLSLQLSRSAILYKRARYFLFYYDKYGPCQPSPLSRSIVVPVIVDIILYDICQPPQRQAVFFRIIAYVKDRVERTQERFHIVAPVHCPFSAHYQRADQLHKISCRPIEDDRFFLYHIFFPNRMFQ